jgi:hypothetical protein
MFDTIITTLSCGAEAHQGQIQTRIRGGAADDSALPIGYAFDPVKLTPESLVRNGYVQVNEPTPGAPIRLLDIWSCLDCGAERWAMVEIADGALRSVKPVELDRVTLDAAHYIDGLNAELLAKSLGDESAEPAVDVLRRRLPA